MSRARRRPILRRVRDIVLWPIGFVIFLWLVYVWLPGKAGK